MIRSKFEYSLLLKLYKLQLSIFRLILRVKYSLLLKLYKLQQKNTEINMEISI